MALKSTIFKANLSIADIDHGYYADHQLTLARHPSETDERMMVRLLALALQAHELQDTCRGDGQLAFGAGLSDPDDPDVSLTDFTGRKRLWIEVGQPEDKPLSKACSRADAHGLAKMSSGLCGSFATSASFSRSAVNLYAGARTGWATLFALLLVLATLLWLTPALYHVPQSVLAAVVVTAVTNLIKPRTMFQLWRISRVETVIGLATFGLTLATAPRLYWGVLVGILMNLSHFLFQRLHPRIIEVGLHADGSLRDRKLWQLPPIAPRVLALRMDAELDFASANALERRVADELAQRPDLLHLCLFALPINRIDVTGVEAFMRLRALLQSQGGMLHVAGIKLPVQRRLESAGAMVPGPNFVTYRTDTDAVAALKTTLSAP